MTQTIELAGARRPAPSGVRDAGEIDAAAPLTLTLHFKRRSPPPPPLGSAEDIARLSHRVTREALAKAREKTHGRAAARICELLTQQGVEIVHVDYGARCMTLRAPTGELAQLFGAKLRLYAQGERLYRARVGGLRVPKAIAPWVRAVVGFDQRPLARAAAGATLASAATPWPSDIAARYGASPVDAVAGQTVAIIALGGGYLASDLAAACAAMGRAPPQIVEQSVGGAANAFAGGGRADRELALDMQALASLTPGARLVVYFAAGTLAGLAAALSAAVNDRVNRPQVISVSWGSPEIAWTEAQRDVVLASLSDAVRLGVTVVAATGDYLATGGLSDDRAHVWFPASAPYALGCGGTAWPADGDAEKESVWNEGFAGTGGGVSDWPIFVVPEYQRAVALPPSVNDGQYRRGAPDVAALAASPPGYRIIVNGEHLALDGTSAATPLWAGIIANVNALRGVPIGFAHPALYAAPALTRPVRFGDNKNGGLGYAATGGWSACAGLGAPRAAEIFQYLGSLPIA